jgi:hypothetical protein
MYLTVGPKEPQPKYAGYPYPYPTPGYPPQAPGMPPVQPWYGYAPQDPDILPVQPLPADQPLVEPQNMPEKPND